MDELYVIVHQECIEADRKLLVSLGLASDPYDRVLSELARLRAEKETISLPITQDPSLIPYDLPSSPRHFFLAGAYEELCVATHQFALSEIGIYAEMYRPGVASLSLFVSTLQVPPIASSPTARRILSSLQALFQR